jgi:hypothetical protein
MASIYTHFSCLLDVGSAENAVRALKIYTELVADTAHENPPSDGFLVSIDPEHGGTQLWIRSDETGDPERVIEFVNRCADAFGLKGRWGFTWAGTCSRPHINAFNGGAHVIDLATGETVAWIYTATWLADVLEGATRHA